MYEKCGFKLVGDEQKINDRMTIVYYEKEVKRKTWCNNRRRSGAIKCSDYCGTKME